MAERPAVGGRRLACRPDGRRRRAHRPVVRAFVAAVNAGDREAFFALLAPAATMSDDGRSLLVTYTNSTWGAMRTAWKFVVEGEMISRFETGQA